MFFGSIFVHFAAESADAWMGAAGFEVVQTQDLWWIHQVTRGVKPIPAKDTSDIRSTGRDVQYMLPTEHKQ